MKKISLSQGKYALVDEADYGLISQYKWCISSAGYALSNTPDRKQVIMHRLIMGAPNGKEVDHIDLNRLNNSRSNLRIVSRHENNCNRRAYSNNKSGYKGVSWKGDKWRATITVNGIHKHLGCFIDKLEAAKAYNKAALTYHKEFAKVNEI